MLARDEKECLEKIRQGFEDVCDGLTQLHFLRGNEHGERPIYIYFADQVLAMKNKFIDLIAARSKRQKTIIQQ